MGDDSHLLFRHKLLGEYGSVRRGVVMVKQPGLFLPKFGATSLHVFMQSPRNVAVETGFCINSECSTHYVYGDQLKRKQTIPL
jgi:hypothetical protein